MSPYHTSRKSYEAKNITNCNIGGLSLTANQAKAVTINFEDLSEGTTLSNQYSSLGVTFSPNAFSGVNSNSTPEPWATNTNMSITSTDIGILGSPSLVSGKLLRSFSGWLSENGDPSFSIGFSSPISSFSADFAGILTPSDVSLTIYNGATILGQVLAANCTPDCQQTLSFSAGSITRFAVTPGNNFDWVGVDNITFAYAQTPPTSVPEPFTIIGTFIGGTAAFRMRKKLKAIAD